jgi:hypothetical protein
MKYQIPSINNQIMTKIPKNSKSLGNWSLVIPACRQAGDII